jgi:hypothetical protein
MDNFFDADFILKNYAPAKSAEIVNGKLYQLSIH